VDFGIQNLIAFWILDFGFSDQGCSACTTAKSKLGDESRAGLL
jgi:hypothetical protein